MSSYLTAAISRSFVFELATISQGLTVRKCLQVQPQSDKDDELYSMSLSYPACR